MKKNLNKVGFTLLELAIVLGIIVILASLTFPILAKAREHSKRVSCTNNLKQWGLTLMVYVDDNGGKYPVGDIKESTLFWADVLPPYMNNPSVVPMSTMMTKGKVLCPGAGRNIYVCPSVPIDYELLEKYNQSQSSEFYSSYVYNKEFDVKAQIRFPRLKDGAKTVLFLETHKPTEQTITQAIFENIANEKAIFRHAKTTNICFADGHVENLAMDLSKGTTTLVKWDPYTDPNQP